MQCRLSYLHAMQINSNSNSCSSVAFITVHGLLINWVIMNNEYLINFNSCINLPNESVGREKSNSAC